MIIMHISILKELMKCTVAIASEVAFVLISVAIASSIDLYSPGAD